MRLKSIVQTKITFFFPAVIIKNSIKNLRKKTCLTKMWKVEQRAMKNNKTPSHNVA